MSEEKNFDWKNFTLDKVADLAILIVGLEIYSHREKISDVLNKMKNTGQKYDLPLDELADKIYSRLDQKLNAVLPEKVDEIMKKYDVGK